MNIDTGKEYARFVEGLVLTRGDDRLAENALGLIGEAGEVAEKIKKHFRGEEIDYTHIQRELGDVLFYWFALHNYFLLDPQDTMDMNVAKLLSRSKRGVLKGSGDDR